MNQTRTLAALFTAFLLGTVTTSMITGCQQAVSPPGVDSSATTNDAPMVDSGTPSAAPSEETKSAEPPKDQPTTKEEPAKEEPKKEETKKEESKKEYHHRNRPNDVPPTAAPAPASE
jgi:hypothetical protein